MIVADASFWVSSFHTDIHNLETLSWLKAYTATNGEISAPNLLLAEVAGAVARQSGKIRMGHAAVRRLQSYTFLQIVDVSDRLALIAAELAADCRLRGADAIYVALAYTLNVPLLTWDQEQIARVQGVIQAGTPTTLFGGDVPSNLH
jgi:predicted nucleic acid-binding protein